MVLIEMCTIIVLQCTDPSVAGGSHRLQAGADKGHDVAGASAAAQQRHLPHEHLLLLQGLVLQPLDGHRGHAVGAPQNHPESAPPKLHLRAIIIQENLHASALCACSLSSCGLLGNMEQATYSRSICNFTDRYTILRSIQLLIAVFEYGHTYAIGGRWSGLNAP